MRIKAPRLESLSLAASLAWTVSVLGGPDIGWGQIHRMRAHFIDVGQGDSTVLEFPCGAIMIDAGGRDADTTASLVAYVHHLFERRSDLNNTLQAVFITHPHADHNRALRALVSDEDIRIENYIHNGLVTGAAAEWMEENAATFHIQTRSILDSEITALPDRAGLTDAVIDPINCEDEGIDPDIRVLSGRIETDPGWAPGAFENKNNHSLVIRVDFGEASFLFTGDLQKEAIHTLVSYYLGTPKLDVDVYQVGHHGAENGTTEELMTAMSARVAVISMSPWTDHRSQTGWFYGHPRRLAVDELKRGIDRYRTPKYVHIATGEKVFEEERMRKAIFATGWDQNIVIFGYSDGRLFVMVGQ